MQFASWRLVSDSQNFKFKVNTLYQFHAGYRYYKVGTNTSTGVTTLIGDSRDVTFMVDAGKALIASSLFAFMHLI